MKICVSAANGTESAVKRELTKLGVLNAPFINGRAVFEGDYDLLVKCNIYLYTASRVYIVLDQFKCNDFDTLYDRMYAINWSDYIKETGVIVIKPKLVQSKLSAFSATQSVAKKAVVERLKKEYKCAYMPENGNLYTIETAIYRDFCTILLDASGESLFKRGYRRIYGEAQLKETLAASILELSVWNTERPMADLFTGTGTLAIEAGLRVKNIAPGIYRDFDFLNFANFDKAIYDTVKSEAISLISDKNCQKILAYDIDENQLDIAKKHAKYAGVSDIIEFKQESMTNFKSDKPRGVAFANPPYGERLSDRANIESLYRAYGLVRKQNPEWCFYTITPVSDFERLFGAKADKKRKLFNGRIECCLYAHLCKPLKNKVQSPESKV